MIDLNTAILKWIHQGEQIILMGDCNSEVLEVNIWMETQGLTNKICNLHGYSDSLITHQQSKDWPINIIYCSAPLAANRGGLLTFRILVGDRQDLWMEINEDMILGLRKHDIIPPTARNLCMGDPRTINKSNDKLHTSFVKHDIYQKIHYIHNRAIYPLPARLSRTFEILDKFITHLINAVDKNAEEK